MTSAKVSPRDMVDAVRSWRPDAPAVRLAPIWMLKAIVPFIGPIRRRIPAINGFTADALYTIDSRLEVDTSKARRVLGFDPRPPTESIRDALEWWAARGMLGQT